LPLEHNLSERRIAMLLSGGLVNRLNGRQRERSPL
jgi:hypothetical protein